MIKMTRELLSAHASSFDNVEVTLHHTYSWSEKAKRMYPDGACLKGHITQGALGNVYFVPSEKENNSMVFGSEDFVIQKMWFRGFSEKDMPKPPPGRYMVNAFADRCAFITGHGDITFRDFFDHYEHQIRWLARNSYEFVVGDFKGVDFMAQCLLAHIGAPYTVYHMHKAPRHYVPSDDSKTIGGFKNDRSRDDAMIARSSAIIAWVDPGKKGSETETNVDAWIKHKEESGELSFPAMSS